MKSRGKGLLFAGLGASLWGSAGVTGQVLMDNYHLDVYKRQPPWVSCALRKSAAAP